MEFGDLKTVDLRAAWPEEAGDLHGLAFDFTHWVANNLGPLSEAIGIPMEWEDIGVDMGQFAANILARNPVDGSRILVENQLVSTDHTHLGQIITYLAGLEAQTIIQVASDFQAQHLSAIRWLNEHTTDPYAFFAVRVRVVQIADSPLAPLFEVLERPNKWERRVRAMRGMSLGWYAFGQHWRDFWRSYTRRHPNDRMPDSLAGSSALHSINTVGNSATVVQYVDQYGVGICLGNVYPNVRENRYQDALVKELATGNNGGLFQRFDTYDRDKWPEMADWLHDRLVEYLPVIEKTIAEQPDDDEEDE